MRAFKVVVVLLAIVPLLTGALDIVLGVESAQALGLNLSPIDVRDALLNSEFRSLGTIWFGFGILLVLSVTDLVRYGMLAKILFALLFVAGLARLLTIGQFGVPGTAVGSVFVPVVTALQIVVPVLMIRWLIALERRSFASSLTRA